MKRVILLLIISMVVSVGAFAARPKAIATEGTKWCYRVLERNSNPYPDYPVSKDYDVFELYDEIPCTFEFKGDTVYPSKTVSHKLYRTYGMEYEINGRVYSTEPQLVGLVYDSVHTIDEILGRVPGSSVLVHYDEDYLAEMDHGDLVTSDFDANGLKRNYLHVYEFPDVNMIYWGARLLPNEKPIFQFEKVDSVEVGGEKAACWEATKLNDTYTNLGCLSKVKAYARIVEGIGFISNVERVVNSCGSFISPFGERYYKNGRYMVFSHVEKDGKVVYKGPDYKEPENTSSVDDLVPEKVYDDHYYNLQGQRVDNPGTGIYIHNGKKVVVK